MDSDEKKILPWGRNLRHPLSESIQKTPLASPVEGDPTTHVPVEGSLGGGTQGLIPGQIPESASPLLKCPPDAGAYPIKVGDVFVTRAFYEFLVQTIERMPFLTKSELNQACAELSGAMRELVK